MFYEQIRVVVLRKGHETKHADVVVLGIARIHVLDELLPADFARVDCCLTFRTLIEPCGARRRTDYVSIGPSRCRRLLVVCWWRLQVVLKPAIVYLNCASYSDVVAAVYTVQDKVVWSSSLLWLLLLWLVWILWLLWLLLKRRIIISYISNFNLQTKSFDIF